MAVEWAWSRHVSRRPLLGRILSGYLQGWRATVGDHGLQDLRRKVYRADMHVHFLLREANVNARVAERPIDVHVQLVNHPAAVL